MNTTKKEEIISRVYDQLARERRAKNRRVFFESTYGLLEAVCIAVTLLLRALGGYVMTLSVLTLRTLGRTSDQSVVYFFMGAFIFGLLMLGAEVKMPEKNKFLQENLVRT